MEESDSQQVQIVQQEQRIEGIPSEVSPPLPIGEEQITTEVSLPLPIQEEEFDMQQILESSPVQDVRQKSQQPKQESMVSQFEQMKMNNDIVVQAVFERKRDNFVALRLFQQQQRTYYYNHMNILIWTLTQLERNIQSTREFFRQIYEYFNHIKEGYKQLSKHVSKAGLLSTLSADGNLESNWYGSINDGLTGLLDIKKEISFGTQQLYHWLEQSLLTRLSQALAAYQGPIVQYFTSLMGKKKLAQECLQNFYNRFGLVDRFINLGQGLGKVDMLYQELLLCDIGKHIKQKVVDWGKALSQFWQALQNNESILFHSLQKNIELFFMEYGKLHKGSEKCTVAQQAWESMKTEDETTRNYSIDKLLADDQRLFIKQAIGKETLKNIDFERFVQLQKFDQMIGNIQNITDYLFLKKFTCKIDNNNSDIVVYSTVDGYLVFAIQCNKKALNKMLLRDTVVRRINASTVQVNEKQKAFLVNRWNKEKLHFASENQAEEFMFCAGKTDGTD